MLTPKLVPALLALLALAVSCKGRDAADGGDVSPHSAPSTAHVPRALPAPSARPVSRAQPPGLSCVLQVAPSSGNRHAVSFAMANGTDAAVSLRYYHPLGFALQAWVDDKLVALRIPATDSPVVPRSVVIEPGASVTLSTPVALSFGPGSRDSDQNDPHRWWLDRAPARVRLLAKRAFDSHNALTCAGDWVGTPGTP